MTESTTDPWQAFQLADTLDRLRMIVDPERRALLQPLLGDDVIAAYLALAADVDLDARPHLGGDGPSLVFVPGVMGSLLMSSGLGTCGRLQQRPGPRRIRRSADATLATAFPAAGAVTVVCARWALPDGATSLLMFMFHHQLRRHRRRPAMRPGLLSCGWPTRTGPRRRKCPRSWLGRLDAQDWRM